MRILGLLILLLAVQRGYEAFSERQAAEAWRALMATADTDGFLDVPPPEGQDADTVYVVAAVNCGRESARLADQLAKELAAQGVPVVRVDNISFRQDRETVAAMHRLELVMKAPVPLVFIHGRVASTPELSHVIHEYYRSERALARR